MKRQRGRGRKPGGGGGGHQPNRTLESTGPDVKIRGSASHIYEKYLQLSRDAHSSGDRVMAESYAQYAEHYFRLLRAMQPQIQPQFEQRFSQDYDYEDDESEGGEDGAEAQAAAGEGEQPEIGEGQHRPRREGGYQGERHQGERHQGERPQGERAPYQGEGQGQDGEGGFRNRRRRNRGRFRPDGERGDRGPREGGEPAGPVEGFGDSVPAFVVNE
jgi:hypothetical protein